MSLSPEQLAMRRTGISGSELAAVCGLNPWCSPVNVWENKVGLHKPDISMNSAIIRGTLFEPAILQWYSLLSGRSVVQPTTLRHPEYPLIMATPDGIASLAGEADRCLEVKSPGWQTQAHWGTPGTDEIDEIYIPQVQSQMAVTGLKMCDVVMFTGVEPRIYHVAYNEELFQALREVAEKFWHDYVVPRKPPPPDKTPMYGEFLARYIPQTEAENPLNLLGNGDAAFWVKQLKLARAQLTECESMEEQAKNNLKMIMGGHAIANAPGAKLTWKNSKARMNTDWAAVCKEAKVPKDVVAKHTAPGKQPRPFKITFAKE